MEDAIRKAVAIGGDADTQACITGSIAEAFYNDDYIDLWYQTMLFLPSEMITVVNAFTQRCQRK